LPSLLFTILLWLCLIYLIILVPPESLLAFLAFYALSFLSLFFTLSLSLANSRRGGIFALGLTGLIFLQQIKLLNILNFVLWAGVLLSLELYLSRH